MLNSTHLSAQIAVVIPCFKTKKHILDLIARIGSEVCAIYVVDDCCPEGTGDHVKVECKDPRVNVIYNSMNLGVGGAVMSGYSAAINDGYDIFVKIDGDGQMDPALIPSFVSPIISGDADYVKGNRFFDPESLTGMPFIRLFGNAVLSFFTKLSTGYWHLFDPTNGYTAIHSEVAKHLHFHKISQRYFFETDVLFRLGLQGAVVYDLPMAAHYADEESNLNIRKVIPEFLLKHCRNASKRFLYRYILRDFSLATLEFFLGLILILFGTIYGASRWYISAHGGPLASAGAVMLAALPLLAGLQFLLAFFNYDMLAVPKRAVHPSLVHQSKVKSQIVNVQKGL
ncbi:glycosyltransferase family 2 protein [Pseudomonas sp. BGI-2]|uniref:glycosyltransferase family 2 protein n=1 Tax=Pseudomonas sp. BGI-2 TaxID=2528211 RepID=UPI001033CA9B|nr:glycosyltransferase family 2 protein [Pseudomonas sp. BGI-2]TBN43381.1 glycosyltransferase family 2 protein [Pseudomonas sp. BGI-2]